MEEPFANVSLIHPLPQERGGEKSLSGSSHLPLLSHPPLLSIRSLSLSRLQDMLIAM